MAPPPTIETPLLSAVSLSRIAVAVLAGADCVVVS
jgi:hypothetical protein